MPLSSRLRILFLAANPEATSRLDLEEELRSLESELRSVEYRNQIDLVAAHAVRPDDLVRLLRREVPNVVHFSGHGSHAGIILRSDKGYIEVSGNALARVLDGRGVKLIVLNACFSDLQADPLTIAVPSVVGTTASVGDEAARRFSTAFFRTLGDGHPVGEAFRDGRDAVDIHMLEDVFRMRGDETLVLCGQGATALAPKTTAELVGVVRKFTSAERLVFRAVLKAERDIESKVFREFFRAPNALSGNGRDGYLFRLAETVDVAESELLSALGKLEHRRVIFSQDLSDILYKPTQEVVSVVNRSPAVILGMLYTPAEVENRPIEEFYGSTHYKDGKPDLYCDIDDVPLQGPFIMDVFLPEGSPNSQDITYFRDGRIVQAPPLAPQSAKEV